MRSRPGGWAPGGAPPEPAHIRTGTSVGRHPRPGGPADVPGIVSTYGGGSIMTSQGLQGRGNYSHPPLDTLCTPPQTGYDRDSVGREPDPPPLPQLKHVCPMGGAQQAPPHYCSMCEEEGTEALEAGRR